MTPDQPITQPCAGVTVPHGTRTLRRCSECKHFEYDAVEGLMPAMRQRADGSWYCPNELPTGSTAR